MNPLSDETQIRELMQRLKRADARRVPTFEDVLARPERKPQQRPTRRPQLAIACGLAAAVLVAFWFVRPQQTKPGIEPRTQVAEIVAPAPTKTAAPHESVVEIDFDQLRRAIEQHFETTETASGVAMPLWSSRTDSLLAVNLDLSIEQE